MRSPTSHSTGKPMFLLQKPHGAWWRTAELTLLSTNAWSIQSSPWVQSLSRMLAPCLPTATSSLPHQPTTQLVATPQLSWPSRSSLDSRLPTSSWCLSRVVFQLSLSLWLSMRKSWWMSTRISTTEWSRSTLTCRRYCTRRWARLCRVERGYEVVILVTNVILWGMGRHDTQKEGKGVALVLTYRSRRKTLTWTRFYVYNINNRSYSLEPEFFTFWEKTSRLWHVWLALV